MPSRRTMMLAAGADGTLGCVASSRVKRQEASDAVSGLGWRLLLGNLVTQVRTGSLAQAAEVAAELASGIESHDHLQIDLRPHRLYLSLSSPDVAFVTARDLELAREISAKVTGLGLTTDSGGGACGYRPVQLTEICIDALDISAVRPFWRAVFGYADEPGPSNGIIDPAGQGPALWFQQMDEPRPQRNRIHFDVSVPHDEAQRRIEAAVAAGGTVIDDTEAPAFWVIADPEGNEVCICTWQGRDP